jgi:hypothetical protein
MFGRTALWHARNNGDESILKLLTGLSRSTAEAKLSTGQLRWGIIQDLPPDHASKRNLTGIIDFKSRDQARTELQSIPKKSVSSVFQWQGRALSQAGQLPRRSFRTPSVPLRRRSPPIIMVVTVERTLD